ncbi:MAG: hypothetical protein GX364_03445 [Firmicutes bacterium]|nr:hypothetical protein [Bacillota bacterium]
MRTIDFILLGIIIVGMAFYFWHRYRRPGPRKPRKRSEMTRLQGKALEVLAEAGYTLQEKHPSISVVLTVDGQKRRDISHEADFIVRKKGRLYLVKIVKGERPTPLTSVAFRKELLLDHFIFLPHGILIYNANNDRFQELHFASGGYSVREKLMTRLALVLLIVAGVAVIVYSLYREVLTL